MSYEALRIAMLLEKRLPLLHLTSMISTANFCWNRILQQPARFKRNLLNIICSTTLHRGGGALTMCSLIPSVWADNHDEKMLVACQCSHMLTWFPIISISLVFLGTIFYMQQLRSCMDLITCESELHCRVSRMPCPMLIHMGNGYAMMH